MQIVDIQGKDAKNAKCFYWEPRKTWIIPVGASLLANAAHENQQLRGQAGSYNYIDPGFSRSPIVFVKEFLCVLGGENGVYGRALSIFPV